MNEIKESDIQVRSHDGFAGVWIKTESPINTLHNTVNAYELKQQILQNQKDAQEYQKIKDESLILNPNLLEEIENYKTFNNEIKPHKFLREGKEDDCQECGFPERFHQKRLSELQSQHKKLVDAIQNKITELEKELEKASTIQGKLQEELNKLFEKHDLNKAEKLYKKKVEGWGTKAFALRFSIQQLQNLLKESEKE